MLEGYRKTYQEWGLYGDHPQKKLRYIDFISKSAKLWLSMAIPICIDGGPQKAIGTLLKTTIVHRKGCLNTDH